MTFMFLHYMYVYLAHKTSPIKWCCHVAGDLHAGVPGLDICTDLHGVWGERTITSTCTYTRVFSGGPKGRRDASSMMSPFSMCCTSDDVIDVADADDAGVLEEALRWSAHSRLLRHRAADADRAVRAERECALHCSRFLLILPQQIAIHVF